MKNNLFILGAFLCTALFVTSCTDDNKDDDENEGKASIIVGINMQPHLRKTSFRPSYPV